MEVPGKRLFRQLNSSLQPTRVNVENQNLIGFGHDGVPVRALREGGCVDSRRQFYFGRQRQGGRRPPEIAEPNDKKNANEYESGNESTRKDDDQNFQPLQRGNVLKLIR